MAISRCQCGNLHLDPDCAILDLQNTYVDWYTLLHEGNQETKGNLIQKYIINSSHGGQNGVQEMLLDAYNNRTAVLILDGLVRESHHCSI